MKFNSISNKLYKYNYSTENDFFFFYQKVQSLGYNTKVKWNSALQS